MLDWNWNVSVTFLGFYVHIKVCVSINMHVCVSTPISMIHMNAHMSIQTPISQGCPQRTKPSCNNIPVALSTPSAQILCCFVLTEVYFHTTKYILFKYIIQCFWYIHKGVHHHHCVIAEQFHHPIAQSPDPLFTLCPLTTVSLLSVSGFAYPRHFM